MEVADKIRKAAPDRPFRIGAALRRAFFDDPVLVWGVPDLPPAERLVPEFFTLYAKAFLRDDGDLHHRWEAWPAALWAPPGAEPVSGKDAQELGTDRRAGRTRCPTVPGGQQAVRRPPPARLLLVPQFMGVDPGLAGPGYRLSLVARCWSGVTARARAPTWTRPASATGGCTSGTGSRPRSRSPRQGAAPVADVAPAGLGAVGPRSARG